MVPCVGMWSEIVAFAMHTYFLQAVITERIRDGCQARLYTAIFTISKQAFNESLDFCKTLGLVVSDKMIFKIFISKIYF